MREGKGKVEKRKERRLEVTIMQQIICVLKILGDEMLFIRDQKNIPHVLATFTKYIVCYVFINTLEKN